MITYQQYKLVVAVVVSGFHPVALAFSLFGLQAKILDCMTLPRVCSSPVGSFMLAWELLISDHMWPEGKDHEHPESLSRYVKYASGLQDAAVKGQQLLKEATQSAGGHADDEDKLVGSILQFAVKYSEYLLSLTNAKCLANVLEKPREGLVFVPILTKKWRPFARAIHFLDLDSLDTEVLTEMDHLLNKAEVFGMICILMEEDISKDPIFKTMVERGQAFKMNFVKGVEENLKTFDQSLVREVEAFVKTYTPVFKAAATWTMDGVAWAFQGDDAKRELEKFNSNLGNMKSFLKSFTRFANHKSSQKDMSGLTSKASEAVEGAKKIMGLGCELVCSGYFLENEQNSDIKDVVKYVKESYDVKPAGLPAKLASMVANEMQKGGQTSEGQPSAQSDGTPSAAASSKKDKKIKKDKDEKKQKKDKEKKDKDKKDKEKKVRKWRAPASIWNDFAEEFRLDVIDWCAM